MTRDPTINARSETLRVLASGGDVDDVYAALGAARTRRRDSQPYIEELLELATDALALTGARPDEPIPIQGLLNRYLPEREYRGKVDHRNIRYALTYPAIRRGGLQPDLYDDIVYWQAELWPYVVDAVVAYLRIAAERAGEALSDLAQKLQRDG